MLKKLTSGRAQRSLSTSSTSLYSLPEDFLLLTPSRLHLSTLATFVTIAQFIPFSIFAICISFIFYAPFVPLVPLVPFAQFIPLLNICHMYLLSLLCPLQLGKTSTKKSFFFGH